MYGINVVRLLLGGIVAGGIVWIMEGAASIFYMEEMQTAMLAHNLAMEMSAGFFALTVIVSLLSGFSLIFFYAAARPRFGAGPKTATIVAVAYWLGSSVISILGYKMIGLYPVSMLALWGVVGLVEMIVASLAGAALYREE